MEIYLITAGVSFPFVFLAWKSIYRHLRLKFYFSCHVVTIVILSCIFYPAVLPALWASIAVKNLSRYLPAIYSK